ncbi:MAG: PilZ domain-containing protein [Desulfomonile tiedjei]|nr:PilZ domain-containing protein [Desulfomonile tiedjei]
MSRDDFLAAVENRRKARRKYLLFKIPAYDAQTRRFLGLLQDISETGVQLFGVKVDEGSTRELIVQASDYVKSAPLKFTAICRWSRRESAQGYFVSGLEIVEITTEVKKSLMKLMESVTLG